MNPLDAYQQQTPNWTRIDMLIAAFDGTIARLKRAADLLQKNAEDMEAQALLIRCQRIVCELYAGLNLEHGEIPKNMQQLYLFVLSRIGLGDKLEIDAAINVLMTIREGLGAVRQDAMELEKSGMWDGVDQDASSLLQAVG